MSSSLPPKPYGIKTYEDEKPYDLTQKNTFESHELTPAAIENVATALFKISETLDSICGNLNNINNNLEGIYETGVAIKEGIQDIKFSLGDHINKETYKIIAEKIEFETLCPRCKSTKVDMIKNSCAVCSNCKSSYVLEMSVEEAINEAKRIKEEEEYTRSVKTLDVSEKEEDELPF